MDWATEQVAEQNERKTFHIPDCNLGRLRDKIAKMNKRGAKLGCPAIEIEIIREYKTVHPDYKEPDGIVPEEWLPKIKMVEIAINGEGPKIAGWKFVGTLDHNTLPGSVIVNAVPGETVPKKYHNHDATCAHCNKIRRRKETFVLLHDDGHHTHVGRQCLKDFLGHDPRRVASFLTSLMRFTDELDEDEWRGYRGGREEIMHDHITVLQTTAAVIKDCGWVPRSSASAEEGRPATAGLVIEALFPPKTTSSGYTQWKKWKDGLNITDESNRKEAEGARDWLKTQKDDNEYMHNLHMIDKAEGVPVKLFGYWCSLVAAYQRAQERLRLNKAAKKLNEHFGEIKKRIELDVKVISIRYTDGYYGTVGIVRMLDEKGRTAIWFANTDVKMEAGKKYRIKGTVKKHDEYNDWKQTVLNRVSVVKELEDAE